MIPIGFCLATFGVRYSEIREAARQIDALGFDSIWLWDHYVSWNDPRESVLESWTTLAGLAEATERVRLGPLVANNTNRHPGRLAKVAATLHELSGGRCELGIGAGGLEYEQAQFGIVQGSPGERSERLEEALQIIPALWVGDPVTFQGKYYQLTNAIAAPRQDPLPQLIVGANGPRLSRMAGRYADGLNLQWRNRDTFPACFAALDEGLAQRGRSRAGFDLSIHPSWNELANDPARMLSEWEALGFTRVIAYVDAPFPLTEFERLARLVGGSA
jgi:alkanesulfonate monooxygenase SsuD/methylene tetrahydromethanopterin reductase-like flavin-dependent oxidoreductase (luciferase family)